MKPSGKLEIIWKNPDHFESIGTVYKVFFLLYAQKLSGRAKTFWVAILPCYPGFCASAVEVDETFDKAGGDVSYLVDDIREKETILRVVKNEGGGLQKRDETMNDR